MSLPEGELPPARASGDGHRAMDRKYQGVVQRKPDAGASPRHAAPTESRVGGDHPVRLMPGRIQGEHSRLHAARSLRRAGSALSRRTGKRGAHAFGAASQLSPALQRSLVKISYVSGRRAGAWRRYGHYLSRPDAQREHDKGIGFDAKHEEVYLPDRFDSWQREDDPRLWKVIVSPEAAGRIDLRAHARALAHRIERDLGTRIEWAAIEHHDTDHAHVHLVLRGVDAAGREVRMPREYVRVGIRARSQELLTRELGPRNERERNAARGLALEAQRPTEIDRGLRRRAAPDGTLTLSSDAQSAPARLRKRQEIARLRHLVTLGLAERMRGGMWRLSPNLERGLRELQLSGDIQKSLWRGGAVTDPKAPIAVHAQSDAFTVRGRIAGTALGEEHDRVYLIVEGTDGLRHVIARNAAMQRARDAGGLRPGRVVTVVAEPSAGGTRVLVHGPLRDLARAETTDSPLDLDALRSLRDGTPTSETGGAKGFRARWWRAVQERIPLLERDGLVRRLPAGGEHSHEITEGAERTVEERMNQRERSGLRMSEVELRLGKSVRPPSDTPGRTHQGFLLAYAVDESGQLHAVIDTGRAITPIPVASRDAEVGREIRARAVALRAGARANREPRSAPHLASPG